MMGAICIIGNVIMGFLECLVYASNGNEFVLIAGIANLLLGFGMLFFPYLRP